MPITSRRPAVHFHHSSRRSAVLQTRFATTRARESRPAAAVLADPPWSVSPRANNRPWAACRPSALSRCSSTFDVTHAASPVVGCQIHLARANRQNAPIAANDWLTSRSSRYSGADNGNGPAPSQRELRGHIHQLLGSGVIERPQQDGVDNRENRRVCADAQRERQQRRCRESRSAPERAHAWRRSRVRSSSHMNDRTSRYTSLVCVTPPKLTLRRAARVLGGKALANVLVCRFGKMAGDLVVEVAIHLPGTNEGPQPRQERSAGVS